MAGAALGAQVPLGATIHAVPRVSGGGFKLDGKHLQGGFVLFLVSTTLLLFPQILQVKTDIFNTFGFSFACCQAWP